MIKKNIEAIYPLSPQQLGMFVETLSTPDSGIHVEQHVQTFHKLDVSAFMQAWQRIVDRHSVLRTAFVWKDQPEPLQVVFKKITVPIEQEDWQGLSASEQEDRLEEYLDRDRQRGFEFSSAPLTRMALFQLGESVYQFVWTIHHILMDGWCQPIIDKEFVSLYLAFTKGQELELERSRPYGDYIAWLKRQDLSKAEKFWRNTLQGFTKPTPLSTKEEVADLSGQKERYGSQKVSLSAARTEALQALVRQHHLTLNTLVQGMWALLLSRYSGLTDVVFGTTVAGRPPDLTGAESMIGLFINTVPLRVRISPEMSSWSWLEHIQSEHLDSRHYEYCSTGQVHQWSEVPGSLPLYESILVFQNYPVDALVTESPELTRDVKSARSMGAQTGYGITLMVAARSELGMRLVYDNRRLESSNASRILEQFLALLQSIVGNPLQQVSELLQLIPSDQIPKIRPFAKLDQQSLRKNLVAPGTPTEKTLATLWCELLGVESVDIDDNFLQWGGHSLLGTQLMSRVRRFFGVELPLRSLFESPTIAGLAKRIESARRVKQGTQLRRVRRGSDLSLSFAQQRLWFLDQLEPGKSFYNLPVGVRLKGSLNIAALERSLNEILRRHEALRTTFAIADGGPKQVIGESGSIEMPLIDLSHVKESERETRAQELVKQEAQRPFDLTKGPLLRGLLLELGKEEHVLLLTMHHIVGDGWSTGVLFRELTALYRAFSEGKESPLQDLPIQYADFAHWQRERLQGEFLDEQLSYWREQLRGAQGLELPTDHPRPAVQNFRGAWHSSILPESTYEALKALSQQEGATLFMTLLAGFQTLLSRYTGQDDIIIGTDVANRTQVETEDLIGFFVNLLVLRTNLSGNPTFRGLLTRVREVALGAYAHQDLPFEKLVEDLNPDRDPSRNPLVQVLFVLQNTPQQELNLQGLASSKFETNDEASRFDLGLFLMEKGQGLEVTWSYSVDLFEAQTISRMASQFETLLGSIVAQPDARLDALDMLSESDKEELKMEKRERQEAQIKRLKSIKRKAVDLTQGTT